MNIDVVQVAKLYRKKGKSWFCITLISLWIRWKYRNLIAHLKHLPNHCRISVYLSLKCTSNNFIKNIIFRSFFTLGAKIKNLKPYCASAGHAQSDLRIWFRHALRCKRSSSDKKFFGGTEMGDNNIPALSLETVSIKSCRTVSRLWTLIRTISLIHPFIQRSTY